MAACGFTFEQFSITWYVCCSHSSCACHFCPRSTGSHSSSFGFAIFSIDIGCKQCSSTETQLPALPRHRQNQVPWPVQKWVHWQVAKREHQQVANRVHLLWNTKVSASTSTKMSASTSAAFDRHFRCVLIGAYKSLLPSSVPTHTHLPRPSDAALKQLFYLPKALFLYINLGLRVWGLRFKI